MSSDNWKKIYRSLIFMDCWLSYTLGYNPEVNPIDIKVIHFFRLS